MPQEIERQYVVNTDHPLWKEIKKRGPDYIIVQSTIHRGEGNKLRVRLIEEVKAGKKKAAFTFKVKKVTKRNEPNIRDEYEWEVPYRVALFIMVGHGEVRKNRYEYIHTDGKKWEFDEYLDKNEGIILADIELEKIDEKFEVLEWLGAEVTKDKKITNNSFTLHPYMNWSEDEKSWFEGLKKKK